MGPMGPWGGPWVPWAHAAQCQADWQSLLDCRLVIALGVGRMQLTMITMGILLGGNIRVGFEDSIYLRKGVLAKSNAETVEMAVNLVGQLQREVATPSEARQMLGLSHGTTG